MSVGCCLSVGVLTKRNKIFDENYGIYDVIVSQ